MSAITCTQNGDYLLPDIAIPETTETLGKYGMMRKNYLREHRGTLYSAFALRDSVQPLSGNRTDGDGEIGADDVGTDGAVTAAGQSNRPDGLGSAHEQPESVGGRSDNDGIDLQLERENTEIQAETPSDTGGVSASGDTITDDEINAFLASTTGKEDGKYRVFSYFLHERSEKEKADFLKDEYGWYGTTAAIQGAESSWAESRPTAGMLFQKGRSSNPTAEATISWTNAVRRVERLINENRYMTEPELSRLPSYERQMLGAGVIRFFSGLPLDMPRPIDIDNTYIANFWEEARRIGGLLDNPETLTDILAAMRPIMANTPEGDRYYSTRKAAFDSLTAFENGTFTLFPNLETVQMGGILSQSDLISQPLSEKPLPNPQPLEQISLFPSEQEQINSIEEVEQSEIAMQPVVITQDDIDAAITAWNGDISGKLRVFEYMKENSRARSTADFLRNEYGGSLPNFTVTKDGADSVSLSWQKIQQRIGQLMDAGLFMLPEELAVPEAPEPQGVILTQAVIRHFTDAETLQYAVNKDGALFISNDYFIMRTAESDINVIAEQINGRRRTNLIEPRENLRILEHIENSAATFELPQEPHLLRSDRRSSYVYADEKQYSHYDKNFIDVFQFTDYRLFVDNSGYDIRSHNAVVKDPNGGILGLVLPVKVDETLYERLADVLPLDIPWKSEIDRARENPTGDPYIGREFFDGRDAYFISGITNVRGVDMYSAPTIKDGVLSGGARLIPVAEMETQIGYWEINRSDAEKAQAAREVREAEEAAARIEYERVNGFADNMPPMQKANVLRVLNDTFHTRDYGRLTMKGFIETAVKDGKTVSIAQYPKKKYQDMDANEYLREISGFSRSEAWSRYRAALTNPEAEDGENAVWLRENHPFLHYSLFHDMSVLPGEYLTTEYRVNMDDRQFYTVSKTAHDYGKYLIDNGIIERQETLELPEEIPYMPPEPGAIPYIYEAVTEENVPIEQVSEALPQGNSMWQQYQAVSAEHQGKIVFVQVGDFYEVLGSDAADTARFLNLTIMSRDVGLPERVPMFGVPDFSLDGHVDTLISNGFGVVVIDKDGEVTVRESDGAIGKEAPTPEKTRETLYNLVDKMRSGNLYYSDVEEAAFELNLALAEYGDQNPDNHYGAEAYAFFNPAGDRNADDILRVDYNFNDDGGAGKAANLEIDFTAFGIEPPLPTLAEQEFETLLQATAEANAARFRETWSDISEPDIPENPPQNEQLDLFSLPVDSSPAITPMRETPDISENISAAPQPNRINFRITDDRLGEGGAKTKYAFNAEAIRTLQAIEAENRLATPEEQRYYPAMSAGAGCRRRSMNRQRAGRKNTQN